MQRMVAEEFETEDVEAKEKPNLENSIRFDMSDRLDPRFDGEVAALAREIAYATLERVRKIDIEQYQAAVSAVVANLVRAYSPDRSCFVGISRWRNYYVAGRYNCQGIRHPKIIGTLDYMRDHKLITHESWSVSKRTGSLLSTRIRLTPAFRECLAWAFSAPFPFTVTQNSKFECIRLKDKKKTKRDKRKKLIDYDETQETREMRERLKRWNEFLNLQWADLYVTDEQFKSLYKEAEEDEDDFDPNSDEKQGPNHLDLSRGRLHRVFNNRSFAYGGRFYGGWWQWVPSKWRKFITINWHPTHELDYSNMQPAMLYAMIGLSLNSYAYDLDGVPKTDKNKRLIKKTFLQIINSENKRMRPPEHKEMTDLPPDWNWRRLREAIKAKHEPIKAFFYSGKGIELQRMDSDIAEAVMLSMMEKNILVLPIHDSFLVRREHYKLLRDEMYNVYKAQLRQHIGVSFEPSFLDRLGPFFILSASEPMHEVFELRGTVTKGYEEYFERKKYFLSSKSPEWFSRFNPR